MAILDVMLPPFDGWELAAQLREAYGDDIGLIFMTAVPVAEAEQRADGFRAAFVPKPFDPLALPVFVKAVAPRRRRSLDS